jgi:hypothetical protein
MIEDRANWSFLKQVTNNIIGKGKLILIHSEKNVDINKQKKLSVKVIYRMS